MKVHAFRLLPGQDLKAELTAFLQEQKIEAAALLSVVGSLRTTRLRLAGAKTVLEETGPREVLSLSGTLSQHGSHLHLSVSNEKGECKGGHLMDGCIINTTMELIIGELPEHVFHRAPDTETGFDELVVTTR
jgi:uncharacterized protein